MQPDDTKTLDALTRFSEIVRREIGVCVCEDGQTTMTFGDDHSGQIRCVSDEPIFLFHTHPKGLPLPSAVDLATLMNIDGEGDLTYCIGALQNGESKIKCFEVSKHGNKTTFQWEE